MALDKYIRKLKDWKINELNGNSKLGDINR